MREAKEEKGGSESRTSERSGGNKASGLDSVSLAFSGSSSHLPSSVSYRIAVSLRIDLDSDESVPLKASPQSSESRSSSAVAIPSTQFAPSRHLCTPGTVLPTSSAQSCDYTEQPPASHRSTWTPSRLLRLASASVAMTSLEPTPFGPSRTDEPDSDTAWFLSSTPTSPPLSQPVQEPVTKQDRPRLDAAPLDPVAVAFQRQDLHEPARERDARAHSVARDQARRREDNVETGAQGGRRWDGPWMAALSSIDGIDSVTSTPRSSQAENRTAARPVAVASQQQRSAATAELHAREITPPFAFDLSEGDPVNPHVELGQASPQSFLT